MTRLRVDDDEFKPVAPRGLPAPLPADESILWQSAPQWTALARSAFHVVKVVFYFGLLIAWRIATGLSNGDSAATLLGAGFRLAFVGGLAVAILCLLAWFYARGTVYTLTNKRIVIRTGLSLPITINLPLTTIEAAAVTKGAGGTGSIALRPARPNRIALLAIWPNARPWVFSNPEPMLRCVPDIDQAARLVGQALLTTGGSVAQDRSAVTAPVSAGIPAGLAA